MKRMKLFFAVLIIAGISFSACYEPSGDETTGKYYYEQFTVSKAKYNSVKIPPSNPTFNSIVSYRDNLKKDMKELIRAGSNVDQEFIHTILTQLGLTSAQANEYISVINNGSNLILPAELLGDADTYLITYVSKMVVALDNK